MLEEFYYFETFYGEKFSQKIKKFLVVKKTKTFRVKIDRNAKNDSKIPSSNEVCTPTFAIRTWFIANSHFIEVFM